MKNSMPPWWPTLLIAACGLAGYALGNARQSEHRPTVKADTVLHPPVPSRDWRVEVDALENFGRLLAGTGTETDIWKIVSRLPAESIPDALQRLRETMSETAGESSDGLRLAEIESGLYFHWAESDPVAALADVSKLPGKPDEAAQKRRNSLLKSVLAAWMRVDPNTAYRAVKDHEDFGYIGRDMLVGTWTSENVFENLKLFPDKNQDLLGWYCVAAAKNATQRNAMLAALKEQPDMKDRKWGYFMLFRDWAYRDFPAAMAEAAKHDQPGLKEHVFEDGLNQQPAAAIRWAVSQNLPPGGPRWEQGYQTWLMYDAEDAQRWLDEQTPVWKSTGHTATVADFLSQELDATNSMNGTPSPVEAGKKLTILIKEWNVTDPQAAARWLETAPKSARKILNGEGAADHE